MLDLTPWSGPRSPPWQSNKYKHQETNPFGHISEAAWFWQQLQEERCFLLWWSQASLQPAAPLMWGDYKRDHRLKIHPSSLRLVQGWRRGNKRIPFLRSAETRRGWGEETALHQSEGQRLNGGGVNEWSSEEAGDDERQQESLLLSMSGVFIQTNVNRLKQRSTLTVTGWYWHKLGSSLEFRRHFVNWNLPKKTFKGSKV